MNHKRDTSLSLIAGGRGEKHIPLTRIFDFISLLAAKFFMYVGYRISLLDELPTSSLATEFNCSTTIISPDATD
jgi:hypothetical protein